MRAPIKTAVVSLLGVTGKVVRPTGHAILTYHSLDEHNTIVSTPPWVFGVHMSHLKSQGFHVTSLRALIDCLKHGSSLPERTVFLTFDDGLENTYTVAFPILEALGFRATVFLATDYIGQKARWYTDAGIPALPMLTWNHINEMKRHGIDFQAHTCSHPHLPQISYQEAKEEMRSSKEVIEHQLGHPVEFFAYPFGEYTPALKELARSLGFVGACTTEVGLFHPSDDRYAIKRMGLNYTRSTTTAQASVIIDACVRGTFTWYRALARSLHLARTSMQRKDR